MPLLPGQFPRAESYLERSTAAVLARWLDAWRTCGWERMVVLSTAAWPAGLSPSHDPYRRWFAAHPLRAAAIDDIDAAADGLIANCRLLLDVDEREVRVAIRLIRQEDRAARGAHPLGRWQVDPSSVIGSAAG